MDWYVRRTIQALVDVIAWLTAVGVATWARYDFSWTSIHHRSVLAVGLTAGLLQVACGLLLRLYQGRYVYGSFEQVLALALSAGVTTTLTAGFMFFRPEHGVPISAIVVAGAGALLEMMAVRYGVRSYRDRRRRPGEEARPVLVLGAGDAGEQLVRGIQRDPASQYRVVGILDDNPSKKWLRLSGVPVLGGREQLEHVARKRGAEMVIISIANSEPALIADVARRAKAAGITVKAIPSVAELVDSSVGPRDIRDLDVTDLLRRRPIATDLTDIRRLLRGKRVLITGAGGSIGSELSRQVHALHPAALGLLDRDESALHALQLSLHGRALLDDDSTILADIRDRERMIDAFAEFRPDIVFHAAALKHLPLLERYPEEAVKSNIYGTCNVLDASRAADVPLFVNISTDKAADPDSVLGYSKRITERLTAAAAGDDSAYVSVRFGNVLGSRGSVLGTFEAQIKNGGPLTVTHREVTRYFMTIPEAVQLVLQAATVGANGDVLVLDMGHPVRIADVARQLIEHSGRDIDIVYTGLRDGEKMAEVLYGATEDPQPTDHPLISRVRAPRLDAEALGMLGHGSRGAALIQALELLSISSPHEVTEHQSGQALGATER
jgi:FlaA1/EpsC-like NDP-sugar epimerase